MLKDDVGCDIDWLELFSDTAFPRRQSSVTTMFVTDVNVGMKPRKKFVMS